MATPFITNWIKETDLEIDYWVNNYLKAPHLFSVTGTPHLPIINANVLRHNLTSCCPTPNFPKISFEHFPEPYYGNPDDSAEKLAVVLFYNPGPQGIDQHINSRGPDTFYDKFIANGHSYCSLSTHLNFCSNTINNFWNPKNVQLNNLLNFIPFNSHELKPLFMDIIPWHSPSFKGLLNARFTLPNTIDEFKSKVIIPATFIAKNSLITRYVNSLPSKTNKIVLLAIGALYSNGLYLNQIGFNNITNTIPAHIGHVMINQRIITGNNSKITIWHITGNHLKSELNDNISELSNKNIYIINLWTPNIGMNIPGAIQVTFNHILQNL
jgi:hypothetical protein